MLRKVQMGFSRRLKAVTILEVLVVLAIIALLAGVVAPRVVGYLGRAQATTAQTQINNIDAALGFFTIDMGRIPTDAEGLSVLITAPAGEDAWAGPYLGNASALTDPWGRDYIYTVTGDGTYTVSSLGRDGQEGGARLDADLSSQ